MAAEIDSDKWEPAPGPVNPRSASAAAAAAAAGAQAAMAMLQARSEGAAGGQAGSFGSQPKSKAKSSNSAGAAANMSLVCQVCVLVDGAALFFVPLSARTLCDLRVFGQGGSCSSCVNNFRRLWVYPSAQGAMYHCARDVLHVRTHSSNGCCGADGCVLPWPSAMQVPDCGVPLTGAHVSNYFRRHRVCVAHAKADVVSMHGKNYRYVPWCADVQVLPPGRCAAT